MRDLNRRQFIDLALNTAKVGGLAVLLGQIPYHELAKKLGVKPQHLPLVFRDWDLQAEAATLPLNYVVTAGTVPTGGNFANGSTELTTNSGSGSGTSSAIDNTDTTYIKNGGSLNIRIDLTGSGGTRTHDTRCTLTALAMDQKPTVGIRLYSESGMNSFNYDWANDSGDTNGFRFRNGGAPSVTVYTGWQYRQIFRDINTLLGAGNWQNDIVLSRHSPSAANGTTKVVILDQQYYGGYQAPVMAWIFQGASDTHYDVAFGAMTAKGLKGTLAIPTSLVGTDDTTYLNWDEILEMQQAGWNVISMSDTTTVLTGLSVSAAEARLATAEETFAANGVDYVRGVIALPGTSKTAHRSDANLLTALANRGYTIAMDSYSGSDVATVGCDPTYGYSLNPYRVAAYALENPDTLTFGLSNLNATVSCGGPRIFRTGAIDGAGVSGQIDPADFTTLLDTKVGLYHHAGTMRCLTWKKFYSGLSGRVLR